MIFRLLGCQGMNCSQACEALPPSTISFHTRVLREAELIHSEKRGVQVINIARKADIDGRFPGLLHAIFRHHVEAGQEKRSESRLRGRSKAAGVTPFQA